MALSRNHERDYGSALILAGLCLLFSALFFGLLAGLQYVWPGVGRDIFSFEKLRPLHVSSAVFWIVAAAAGSVLTFLREDTGRQLRFPAMAKWQFYIFSVSFGAILISYCFGIFSGREYWDFHPLFAAPIIAGWVLFLINYIASIKTLKRQPVYIWMWLTGIVFFLFTYVESNLWVIPYFRDNLVKDMTIQWKSYGSLVGSWNMLIYGSSIYLLDKIAGNKRYSLSNIGFALYFLGLFNLMFNWGHHIYTLPTAPYIKHIAYLVSMTELLLFGRIILQWRASVSAARKYFHYRPYQFLVAADFWIFMTLGLAIAMSVPALNIYMHGTHVIVAHTMGATIGINTLLLLAFAFETIDNRHTHTKRNKKGIRIGFWLINGSLLVFWGALIIAGFVKSYWEFHQPEIPFGMMMISLKPWFLTFYFSGVLLASGFAMVVYPLLVAQFKIRKTSANMLSLSGSAVVEELPDQVF